MESILEEGKSSCDIIGEATITSQVVKVDLSAHVSVEDCQTLQFVFCISQSMYRSQMFLSKLPESFIHSLNIPSL